MNPLEYLQKNAELCVKPEINKEELLKSKHTADIEVLGSIYIIISERKFSDRILPPMSFEEDMDIRLMYFERCLFEDPASEWADSSYTAGRDAAGWFCAIWRDPQTPDTALEKVREWFAAMYLKGDERTKECLVNATLEHIFEVKAIARFFEDWRKNPVLKNAYDEAMLWSERGGKIN